MIEIKVHTTENDEKRQAINVESRAKHSGTYGDFVREMSAVLGALDKTDHGVFIDALADYLMDKAMDNLKKMSESEGEGE